MSGCDVLEAVAVGIALCAVLLFGLLFVAVIMDDNGEDVK